jgi:hypothetical protein
MPVVQLPDLLAAPSGRYPQIRPARRLLAGAHKSVSGLLEAYSVLDATRRANNESAHGRIAENELDVLRAAIVFTSSGLDAAMRRLVSDVARHLIGFEKSAARGQYGIFLEQQLREPTDPKRIHAAMLHADPAAELVSYYVSIRTKASYQGSSDLKKRVRDTLGVGSGVISDSRIERLDEFFRARNAIVHDLDYEEPNSDRIARTHRNPQDVADLCAPVFEVSAELICAAAGCLDKVKGAKSV